MLVPANPNIDVTALLERVRSELDRVPAAYRKPHTHIASSAQHASDTASLRQADLNRHLDQIYARTQPRSILPDWLVRRFPFLRLPFLSRFLIRIHNVTFHDQRFVNGAVIDAFKEMGNEIALLRRENQQEIAALRNEVMKAIEKQSQTPPHVPVAEEGNEVLNVLRRQEGLLRDLLDQTSKPRAAL